MIESLHITNYVLIENLDLVFSSGLIAITGETGSGKSIILGALSLLLGAKADKSDVRKGFDRAEIGGVFCTESSKVREWCEKRDISFDDGSIIIRRVIKAEGKSIYTVNGSPVNIKDGAELGLLLVDFSSQNAHHSLLRHDVQREILDSESGVEKTLEEYRKQYFSLIEERKKKEEIEALIKNGREEADYMSYCLSEIDKAGLREGEEEEIREKLEKEAAGEFLLETVSETLSDIKSASSLLSSSLSSLSKALKKDKELEEIYTRLESADIETDDIAQTLRDYSETLSFSESEIEKMNERLSVIQRIKRRYGGTVEKALKTGEEYREKLSVITDSGEMLSDIEKKISRYEKEAQEKAEELTELRKKGASILQKKVEEKLHKLAMENAEFRIELSSSSSLTQYGKDETAYLIRANKGENISRIEDSASGGELSRIMLAIKSSSNYLDSVGTIVFDEIDAGLGGASAHYVGEELLSNARTGQVIVITHLAQIASRADMHLVVEKKSIDDRTVSEIREVKGKEREEETARLLSGDKSRISLEHARELLSGRNSV